MFDDQGNRVRLFIDRREELFVGDLFDRTLGKLLRIAKRFNCVGVVVEKYFLHENQLSAWSARSGMYESGSLDLVDAWERFPAARLGTRRIEGEAR